jgi:hypothetical protein
MPEYEDVDMPMTGSLTRSDERYISQGFAVINKNLDQILSQLDKFDKKFDKKIDDYSARTDRRVDKNETDISANEVRITRLETYLKIGGMLGGFAVTLLSGIIVNNWGNLTAPPPHPPYSYTK